MKNSTVRKVAALEQLLGICNAHGASYTPSKASIQPTALRSLLELAQQKTEAVIVTRSAHALAVNARQQSFAGLPKLAAQIVRMAAASEASLRDKEDARMIKRKFYPASKKKSEVIAVAQAGEDTTPKGTRSSSRLDREGMMENFQYLIQIVQGIPGYDPSETEFKVETLKSVLSDLKSRCQAVAKAATDVSNARIARDQVLYGPDGVVESSRAAKDYIRGKFGVVSRQTKQASQSGNF
jgi:hypothetical protein